MKYVVTIGREYGSGGRFVAQKLAKKLGIAFYDKNLIVNIAETSGVSVEKIEQFEEKKKGVSNDDSMGSIIHAAEFDAIKRIAEEQSCVIVGRCADYILCDSASVVRVFINAPMEDKIERAVKYYNVQMKDAKKVIKKKNKERKDYYEFYTKKKWGAADSYDLCINSNIGIDECAEIIKLFVKKRFNL